jgi:hypothetical protein
MLSYENGIKMGLRQSQTFRYMCVSARIAKQELIYPLARWAQQTIYEPQLMRLCRGTN